MCERHRAAERSLGQQGRWLPAPLLGSVARKDSPAEQEGVGVAAGAGSIKASASEKKIKKAGREAGGRGAVQV